MKSMKIDDIEKVICAKTCNTNALNLCILNSKQSNYCKPSYVIQKHYYKMCNLFLQLIHRLNQQFYSTCYLYKSIGMLFFICRFLCLQISLFLEGVDSEKIDSVIKPNSIDIKMHDVQGKNYRLSIPKLNKKIVPQKSTIVVMPTKVVITLAKSLKWNWSYLHFDEGKVHWNSFLVIYNLDTKSAFINHNLLFQA